MQVTKIVVFGWLLVRFTGPHKRRSSHTEITALACIFAILIISTELALQPGYSQRDVMMDDHRRIKYKSPASHPWSALWKAPAMMLLGVLAGVGFGVGHHVYYRSLNNTIVRSTEQQQWAVRIGTGLAFITKTAFTAAVGVAFSQYLWVITRKKALSLQSLDAIFEMTSNPLSFLDIHALAHAKLLTIVGLISW